MSLFERIQKKIITESSSDTTGQNKKNKKKEFSSNISRTVKVSKDTEGLGSRQSRLDATNPKKGGYSRVDDAIDAETPSGKTKLADTTKGGKVKTYKLNNTDTKKKTRTPQKSFFDPEKAKADREKLIAKRKEYGIDRKGNISDAGVERYARKTKQLSSGSNVPVKITQADKDIAKTRAVGGETITNKSGKVIGTTTGKYGGRLARTRNKNMPSYDEIKKQIDAKDKAIAGRKIAKKNQPKYIKTKVTDKEIQNIIKKGQQAIPKKSATVTSTKLANVDKAIKDLDDLIIEPKKGDVAKTKRLISKEVKRKTTPKPNEIKTQKNIIKQGPKATPFVTSDKKSLDDFIKAKDPFNVKGEKSKGSSTGGGRGPNKNPEYQRLLDQQRRNQQAYDVFDDSDAGRPGTGNTIDDTKTKNRTTSKPKTKPKVKGNLFDPTGKLADQTKKAKQSFNQFMSKLKTKYPKPKLSLYDPFKKKIPNLEPLKPLKQPFIKPSTTKTATKSKALLPKLLKAVRKKPKGALGVGLLAVGAYGAIKNRTKTKTPAPNKNKLLPVLGNRETVIDPLNVTYKIVGNKNR